jgi:cobalt-zinc-cadmium efflux system membrane fusion protein|nr:efflux RND transporter periplasmic adaptor subunit [Candidatus Acidoferrales bacterium]
MRVGGWVMVVILGGSALASAGCGRGGENSDAGAPPALKVEKAEDANVFTVENTGQFPLIAAVVHVAASELRTTGTVNPDISRAVPVVSLASGRVVEIDARLGDTVQKGQLLLKVQSSDISSAFSDYRKATADEQLAATQLERSKLLYDKGAISLNDLQVAQDTADKAKVDVETTAEKLRVLGNTDLIHPTGIVEIHAPITGVITDQQITNAAGVQGLSSPNPFTISDLSYVWILCDVYENDLSSVRMGDKANVRLNAYPDKDFTGVVSNIGPILDPNIRTAKVRLEVRNPGLMRPGMFATATFHGQKSEHFAAVPATAILHLHDRDWVYIPAGEKKFRRVEVRGGDMLPGEMQIVLSGISVGQQVVTNALEFQNRVEQ